jgi:ribosome biogenesis protein ERB1
MKKVSQAARRPEKSVAPSSAADDSGSDDHEESEESEKVEEEDGDETGDDEDETSEDDDENSADESEEDTSSDDEFERQSSSDDDASSTAEEGPRESDDTDSDNSEIQKIEMRAREFKARSVGTERSKLIRSMKGSAAAQAQSLLHTDDLSSDDEEREDNTVGRVPLHWYDAFDHIGYNIAGKKIGRAKGKDKLDLAIDHKDDPAASRTIYDMYNGKEVVLTERELEIIRRVQAGAFAHPEHDDTPEYVDYFSGIKEVMPLSAAPEPKRRFVPSKWEMMRVMKIVNAIKEGRYKEGSGAADGSREGDPKSTAVYLIWNDQEDEVLAESKRHQFHLPAPKMPLPGHAESYNPPSEYLLTDAEKAAQEELDPKDRMYNFTPKQYTCMRHIPGYENFVLERFERCLDLYLCPRKLKRRLNIDPQTLVPRLPKPKELKPFPNSLCLQYVGHSKAVRSLSLSSDGQVCGVYVGCC